jgi:hypothetical protein
MSSPKLSIDPRVNEKVSRVIQCVATLSMCRKQCYRTVCRKGLDPQELESGLETGVTGASPPTVTSMGGSFYLGGLVQGRRP